MRPPTDEMRRRAVELLRLGNANAEELAGILGLACSNLVVQYCWQHSIPIVCTGKDTGRHAKYKRKLYGLAPEK